MSLIDYSVRRAIYLNLMKVLAQGEGRYDICHLISKRKLSNLNLKIGRSKVTEHGGSTEIVFAKLIGKLFKNVDNIDIVIKIGVDFSQQSYRQLIDTIMEANPEDGRSFYADEARLIIAMSEGLKYEALLSKCVTENILLTKQSPNFIAYVGTAICQFDEGGPFDDQLVNVVESVYDKYGATPSVADQKFRILITERAGERVPGSKVYNMQDLLAERQYGKLSNLEEIWFQIIYSLAVLGRHQIMHNDLHTDNIMIMVMPKKINMYFRYKQKIFRLQTKYLPLIFDWDLGYCPKLGVNGALNIMPNQALAENRFDPRYDFFRLVCSVLTKNLEPVGNYQDGEDYEAGGLLGGGRFEQAYGEKLLVDTAFAKIDTELPSVKSSKVKVMLKKAKQLTGKKYRIKTADYIKYLEDSADARDDDVLRDTEVMYITDLGQGRFRVYNQYDCAPETRLKNSLIPEKILDTSVFDKYLYQPKSKKISTGLCYRFPE